MEIFLFLFDMNPCIAIIDNNTLSNITLRSILWDIYNKVEVFTYCSMDEFIRDSNRHFIHFFVGSDIFFTNVDEFELLRNQTTILSTGPNRRYEAAYAAAGKNHPPDFRSIWGRFFSLANVSLQSVICKQSF